MVEVVSEYRVDESRLAILELNESESPKPLNSGCES